MPRRKRKSKLRPKTPSRIKKRRPARERPRSLQHPELWGLGLVALGLFLGSVIYVGWNGGYVGRALADGLDALIGGASWVVPVAFVAFGGLMVARSALVDVRPFRAGVIVASFGLMIMLGRDQGGYLGQVLGGAVGVAIGATGSTILGALLLVVGALLLSGASLGAILRGSHHQVRHRGRARARPRVAAPRRGRTSGDRRRAASARPKKLAVDAEVAYPDVVEPVPIAPSPLLTMEHAAARRAAGAAVRRHHARASGVPAARPRRAARVAREGGVVRRDRRARRRPARADALALRHRRERDRADLRPARDALRAAARARHEGVEGRSAEGRPELRARDDGDPHPRADPGKQAVGVELPNLSPNLVTLGDIFDDLPATASPLSVWLGKDISGAAVWTDLARMPHLLIAGTTGSGKSGCINALLTSILLRATPDEVRMILIDPKRIELNHYESIPHLLTPVVSSPKEASAVLANCTAEMERRYERLASVRARNLNEANRAFRQRGEPTIPYLLVVIDELADLMMIAPQAVEDAVIRLAQKSRAVGIHLVLATQRPSVDVITGMIKANVPSRIAFAVSSMTDSRVILDTGGAESLLGQGDMLFKPLGTSRLQRVQGAYVSEEEIALVVEQTRQREQELDEGYLELPEVFAEADGDERGQRVRPGRGPAARQGDRDRRADPDRVRVAAPAPAARGLHACRPPRRHARAARHHQRL